MAQIALQTFTDALRADGWVECAPYRFEKRNWIIVFDTSSCMELGTADTPRIFDVLVPSEGSEHTVAWTLNLINHLFVTNDRLENLRK